MLLPSLQSALPFLDLHGTPRLEFHQSVFDELRDKLLERVSAIASEGKAEERWVGLRRAALLRPVVARTPGPHSPAPRRPPPRMETRPLTWQLPGARRQPLRSERDLSRYKKLEDLLEKSFSLVKMPSLQPVVMCVMKHLPKVSTAGQQAQGSLCPAPSPGSGRPLGAGEVS